MAVDTHAVPGRRILFTASTWSHLANFHRPYLRALADRGYWVDGACGGAPADLPELARAVPLSLEKKMTSPKNLAAAAQIRRLLASGEYDLVSCHTALAAFFTRLAVEASETGKEQLIFSEADRARVGKQVVIAANECLVKGVAPELPGALADTKVGALLGKVVNSTAAMVTGTGLLTLAQETRKMRGGFVMLDNDVEINCTFETLVRLQREKLEKQVAQVLFPE
mgnify:CR=1 FL=1